MIYIYYKTVSVITWISESWSNWGHTKHANVTNPIFSKTTILSLVLVVAKFSLSPTSKLHIYQLKTQYFHFCVYNTGLKISERYFSLIEILICRYFISMATDAVLF